MAPAAQPRPGGGDGRHGVADDFFGDGDVRQGDVGLFGADHRHGDNRCAGGERHAGEAAAPEARKLVALGVQLGDALIAFGEYRHHFVLLQQAQDVFFAREHLPQPVEHQRREGQARKPGAVQVAHQALVRVLGVDRRGDHHGVEGKLPGMVGHQHGAPLGGDVLQPAGVHAPVALVEHLRQAHHGIEGGRVEAPVGAVDARRVAWRSR